MYVSIVNVPHFSYEFRKVATVRATEQSFDLHTSEAIALTLQEQAEISKHLHHR